jgi:lipid II:glycine glycyltransferase (peptidoglycan interpeptide bridge formation enzyme)
MNLAPLSAVDRVRWNEFVASSPAGHALQSWEWGELKERTGWHAHRLALGEGPEIRACAQVLVRRLPMGVGRLGYVPRGPVLDYGDANLVRATVDALRDFATKLGLISLKVEPEVTEPSEAPETLLNAGLHAGKPVQLRSTIWVDLTAREEGILARMKQKTRYNVRLAEKKGVVVAAGGPGDVDAWYSMYRATAERDGFGIHQVDYYRDVNRIFGERGTARLLLARHEGDLLAGIIVFKFGRTAQYMYGASGNEKRNFMAPYLLQWEGMRWARSQGAEAYDLWGIPDTLDESEELWGVFRHKRGYGGEIVRYIGAFDLVNRPVRNLLLEKLDRPLFRRVARLAM